MLFKNGYIVTEQGGRKGDLRTDGETVAELGERLVPRDGEEVMDIAGKVVLPGGVDAHTHLDFDLEQVRSTDNFQIGTIAAACGGTTTILDHMAPLPKDRTLRQQAERHLRMAEGRAVIDYGLHSVLDRVDDAILNELEGMIAFGITSHAFSPADPGKLSDRDVLELMDRAATLGVLLCAYAENSGMTGWLGDRYRAAGRTAPHYHARAHPPESEAEAAGRLLTFARTIGNAPLYLNHISCGLSAEFIRNARWRGQLNIFAATCPQYLYLDESRYLEPDGLKYVTTPPLREKRDQNALWKGIRDRDIDVAASDHREIRLVRDDVFKTPGGLPGVEARMPLLFSEVAAGRLSFERLTELCCSVPAKLFGLYPRKGVIAAGSDADLVLFDPGKQVRITQSLLHENAGHTPYEGMTLTGWPVMTVSRGEVIVRDGAFLGKPGRGKFLRRNLPDLKAGRR